ncbi:MAG: hypothetical protein V4672_01755 [Verrucomicrobiota bacterium]
MSIRTRLPPDTPALRLAGIFVASDSRFHSARVEAAEWKRGTSRGAIR